MPASVTLSTTTLSVAIGSSETLIKLASTSGVTTGTRLWIDRELLAVTSLHASPWVFVRRGAEATASSAHFQGATVTIGRADQFYTVDPLGAPPSVVLVSPYINVRTGAVFYAQGDAAPDGKTQRWWQQQTTTYDSGPLGARTVTQNPTSST